MSNQQQDRAYWVDVARRLAEPVLGAAAGGRLRQDMPVETIGGADRQGVSHLEALGRLICGLAPWLELGPGPGDDAEGSLRRQFTDQVLAAIDHATNPDSPGHLNFTQGGQPLVDAAFLAHGLLRAPRVLMGALDEPVRKNLIAALIATRSHRPHFSNWLLFSAMIEACLCRMGEAWDRMRVDYAIRQHEQWYRGDGAYGDGPEFHWDYYNSFVIQPMLLDVLAAVGEVTDTWEPFRAPVLRRAQRYASVLERMISPEGTFPPLGRSLAYRYGALQLLGQAALQGFLQPHVTPAQVRCAMTAVIRRMTEAPGTFDDHGWLTIGFCGHQPGIGESYISTGSLYLCTTALVPLGLPANDRFWMDPPADWTARRLWGGQPVAGPDHAH